MRRVTLALLGMFTLIGQAARAELQMPAVFSHNMVLQQGTPVPVWGWANDGDLVTVQFQGQKLTTRAESLKWSVTLRSLKAGGPETLKITTPDKTLVLTNVLIGEVWVCSGQSNMEWPMKKSFESAADIASATNAQIRLLTVPKVRQESPSVLMDAAWETLSPQAVESFSAVAYYFGRELRKTRNVPVGLIGTYWGGTPAEAWISRPSLEINPRYRTEILHIDAKGRKLPGEGDNTLGGNPGKAGAGRSASAWAGGELYNGMVAPLLPFPIKGVIWYQGEANATRAEQYRSLFPDMIRCWRRSWGEPEMPFLLVQLAPFKEIQIQPADSDWAELREAQLLTTRKLDNVAMAVITDLGDEKNIHPPRKEPVGQRLALAARAIAYHEQVEYSGPLYKSMAVQDEKVVITFDHAASGLETRGAGPLQGFAICGNDRKFVWANAYIDGEKRDRVVVSHPKVPKPVAVRFGWADYPTGNLFNKAGLPASPFRTDGFPMVTAGDKKP